MLHTKNDICLEYKTVLYLCDDEIVNGSRRTNSDLSCRPLENHKSTALQSKILLDATKYHAKVYHSSLNGGTKIN